MDLILLEIPRPEPPPWIEREREMRRLALLDADKDLRVAVEATKRFQGEKFAVDSNGKLIPKITFQSAVWAAELEYTRLRLLQQVSEAHDAFQGALKRWAEIQP
jgi:hypothetical protein